MAWNKHPFSYLKQHFNTTKCCFFCTFFRLPAVGWFRKVQTKALVNFFFHASYLSPSMKKTTSTLFSFLLAGLLFLCASCGSTTENKAVEADSATVENVGEAPKPTNLVLIPGTLELEIPSELKEKSRKNGNTEDSIFFELELGVNPMDLEFGMLQNNDENLSLEQMEEQHLYVNGEGKTFEHAPGKKYRSHWYTLTYAMERKFRLTSFKDENDYSTLVDDAKANGNTGLKENQTLSAYTNRYYLKLSTNEAGKSKAFVLVLDMMVGC
jgi:hypothetical protein